MKHPGDTYQHILETMNDGVMVLSDSGEITMFNKAASSILGLRVEDVLGKRLMEVFFSDDQANDEFTEAILNAVYDKESSIHVSAPFTRSDGKQLFLEISSSYLGEGSGAPSGVVMVFKDNTELRTLYDEEKQLTARLSNAYLELEQNTAGLKDTARRKRATRRLVMLFLLLLVLGAAGFFLRHHLPLSIPEEGEARPAGNTGTFVAVRPMDISMRVSLTGNFEPLEIVHIVSPFSGRILKKHASYGQQVKKGAPLLELDTSELQVKLREAETALIKAQQEYTKVANWEKNDEVSDARRNFVKAKKSLDTERTKLAAAKDLLERGIIPAEEYESQQLSTENQELDFKSADEKMQSVLEKGSEENVRIANMALENAKFKFDVLRNQIERHVIRATVDGLVLASKRTDSGENKSMEVGTSFNEGEIILSLGNMEGFTVRTKADEVDMIKLKVGQPVDITGDGFPDTVLKGRIASISSQASSDSGTDSVTFDVVVLVGDLTETQRRRIRLGMMATMEVTIYENPEALVAPIDAVRNGDKGYYVMLRTPTGVESREVTIGMTTMDGVEIKSGLATGDQVQAGGS